MDRLSSSHRPVAELPRIIRFPAVSTASAGYRSVRGRSKNTFTPSTGNGHTMAATTFNPSPGHRLSAAGECSLPGNVPAADTFRPWIGNGQQLDVITVSPWSGMALSNSCSQTWISAICPLNSPSGFKLQVSRSPPPGLEKFTFGRSESAGISSIAHPHRLFEEHSIGDARRWVLRPLAFRFSRPDWRPLAGEMHCALRERQMSLPRLRTRA